MSAALLLACLSGIVLLLFLILVLKLHAFISLLISSICVGLMAGMEASAILDSIQEGMASTLGFVAMVVGLGSIFGALLQHSGGAAAIANHLLHSFGEKNAPFAMTLAGFIIAIPVFFDVAFIILIPIVYALQRRTGKSLLLYAMPLLAGLAVTHAFIPPTPGPVAVADIINADLGNLILMGVLCAIPSALIGGWFFGRFISGKIYIKATDEGSDISPVAFPSFYLVFSIVLLPLLLIVTASILKSSSHLSSCLPNSVVIALEFIGHPFSALIIANIAAWYLLGIKKGFSREELMDVSSKSLGPAGLIILLTGAGGVFKQILIDTGAGEMLAEYFSELGFSTLLFSFLAAAVVRILQGSATVAMITAAGLTAPLVLNVDSVIDKSLIVLAIASGASILSHVNDSGFWLVGKYLGLSEKQTFKSWTVMTCIISITGFLMVVSLSIIF